MEKKTKFKVNAFYKLARPGQGLPIPLLKSVWETIGLQSLDTPPGPPGPREVYIDPLLDPPLATL